MYPIDNEQLVSLHVEEILHAQEAQRDRKSVV